MPVRPALEPPLADDLGRLLEPLDERPVHVSVDLVVDRLLVLLELGLARGVGCEFLRRRRGARGDPDGKADGEAADERREVDGVGRDVRAGLGPEVVACCRRSQAGDESVSQRKMERKGRGRDARMRSSTDGRGAGQMRWLISVSANASTRILDRAWASLVRSKGTTVTSGRGGVAGDSTTTTVMAGRDGRLGCEGEGGKAVDESESGAARLLCARARGRAEG